MSKLKIKNLKCFTDIEIPMNQLTVFTGANGQGKSTAIQAILLLRHTIENLNLEQDELKSRTNSSKIGINDGYMLNLGLAAYLINNNSTENEITISLEETNQSKLKATFQVDSSNVNDLHISLSNLHGESDRDQSILSKYFYYLNAERIGPRVQQSSIYTAFPHTGFQGEHTAHIIASENYKYEVPKSRRYGKENGIRLIQQINAWLEYIMPGVRISAESNSETMSAQIKIENQYTTGNAVISTNIGFGISYVLPILVTGLIAKNGAYMIVENPEAHLHPSAQSRIGIFLAQIAHSGVKVVVETHSDHVLNGIQIACANKTIGYPITTVDFFKQDKNQDQPVVVDISISDKGELSAWPGGFFDQSQRDFRELFKFRKNA